MHETYLIKIEYKLVISYPAHELYSIKELECILKHRIPSVSTFESMLSKLYLKLPDCNKSY